LVSTVTEKPPPGITETETNNNTAVTMNAVVQVADLAVAIRDGVTGVYPGDAFTSLVTVSNLGPSAISSLIINNLLAPSLQNPVILPDQGVLNPFNGTWNALALKPGGSVALTVQATVASNAAGPFTNWVAVSVPPGVTDPVPTNNVAANVNVCLALPDTAVSKSGPTNVGGGAVFSYAITVSNDGLGTANNVVARDVLPGGTTFVSASGNGSATGGIATWTLGTLEAGASTNLTLTVVAPYAGGLLTNVATLTASTPSLHPGHNTSLPVVTTVTPGPADAGRLAITSVDNAGAHLVWYGPAGGDYSIEATTNLLLQAWQVITNFVSTNTVMTFIDPGATNDPVRFYRAKTGG